LGRALSSLSKGVAGLSDSVELRDAVRSDAAATRVLLGAAWVLAGAAILLLPAIVWGRPFIFGDSLYYDGWGGDVLSALQKPWPHPGQAWAPGRSLHGWGFGLHDATPADLRFNLTWLTARSAFYAVPFHLLSRLGGLWLVAGLQALASAWVIRVALRGLAPGSSGLVYVGVIAALAATTSLGFVAAYAMPDIFGGLAILAAAVLMAFPDRLGRAERLGLIALITYAVLAHAENELNVAAALVIGLLWYWRSGIGWRAALGRGAPVAAALAIGLAMTAGGGMVLNTAFGQPVHMAPFAASRLLADGVAQPYLRQTCPASRLAACDLAAGPPVEVEYYLWIYPLEGPPSGRIAEPAAYTLAQFDRLQLRHVTAAEAEQRQRFVAEQSRLVLGGLSTSPVAFVQQAFAATIVQVLNFGIGRDHDSAGMIIRAGHSLLRDQMDALLPGGVECARPGSPTCGRYDLGWVTPLQYAIVLASVVVLGLWGFRRAAAPRDDLAGFLGLILGLVLVNAVLCGVISGPYDRYQARVEWLIPLSALFVLVQWSGRFVLARPQGAKSG